MDLKAAFHHSVNAVSRHLPTILTVTAVAGVGVTAFLTGKATLAAQEKIKEAEKEKGDILKTDEMIKATYKCYIPAAIAGTATVGCIIWSNRSSAQQLAMALTAARNIEKQWKENRDAVTNVFGDKGLRKVDEKINEEHAARYFSNVNSIYETGQGTTLCCEGFLTGILFRANREWVRKCVNDFNTRLIDGEILSYNDFIQMLIPNIDVNVLPNAGEIFGYNLDIRRRTLEIVEDSFLTMDASEPGYIFNVRELPLLNYTVQY